MKSDYTNYAVDLSPAEWIWLPSQRTLANSFVLFRKSINITDKPIKAHGFISADSRYLATVNGHRVQWGPGPCDPRWYEADQIDITDYLTEGENVIGSQVLFYGHGDGTSPMGKPGFICNIQMEYADGRIERIVSDSSWKCCVDRGHTQGLYKRYFVRSLQEEFDARRYPYGWNDRGYAPDVNWVNAISTGGYADRPSMCSNYNDYLSCTEPLSRDDGMLVRRTIPPASESLIPVGKLADCGIISWHGDPDNWFEFRVPDMFSISRKQICNETEEGWRIPSLYGDGCWLTFEMPLQMVGFPYLEIDAPEGTIIEVITQEAHDPEKTMWMDNHYFTWTRFICRKGLNRFEEFDFESFKWIQIHIRKVEEPITIHTIGIRRRKYNWQNTPDIKMSDPDMQKLMDASVNTQINSAVDSIVDGMGRERQQYSGDCGHQLLSIYTAFGDSLLPARFIRTYSEGLTTEGFFMDCWPAYDRMARISQRQIGVTRWGPILDHGVQFVFDCLNHYMYTADMDTLKIAYPRLLKFGEYLKKLRATAGNGYLLPVEDDQLGIPSVWIDHCAYQKQRHKQCAFNLHAAGMFKSGLAELAKIMGDNGLVQGFLDEAAVIEHNTIEKFWDNENGVFVSNLPWIYEENGIRYDDRSLAASILYNQCPDLNIRKSVDILAECPPEMGLNYPCNAGWRYWALVKAGRSDVVIRDFHDRWFAMESVHCNTTLQEDWHAYPDTVSQWSHCCVVPLYILYTGILGLKPTSPGFETCEIRPQPGNICDFKAAARTVKGDICFSVRKDAGEYVVEISIPGSIHAWIMETDGVKVVRL